MKSYKVFWALKFALLFAGFAALMSLAVMGLWNWLVPSLFAGPLIGFWQAAGLLVLTRILLGGFRRGRGWKHGHHASHCGGSSHWQKRFESRWANMSEEERARMKSKFERCGWKMPAGENIPAGEPTA